MRLTQKFYVSAYLAMNEDGKVDSFCQALETQIRSEAMKAGAHTMNDASRIALNVDVAFYGAGAFSYTLHGGPSGPVPMNNVSFE